MSVSGYLICLSMGFFCLNTYAYKLDDLTYVIDQFEPYNYRAEDGRIQGFAVDILHQVWLQAEVSPQVIQVLPWARGYFLAQKQKNTLLFSTTRSLSREHEFKWACPIGSTRIVLIAHKHHNFQLKSLDDAKALKAVAIHADIGHQILQKYHFNETNIELSNSLNNALTMLIKGRVDVISMSESIALPKLVKMGENLQEYQIVWVLEAFPICFAFHKDTHDKLVHTFQQALDKVHQQTGLIQALKLKYHLIIE